jgi:hypothetical protein
MRHMAKESPLKTALASFLIVGSIGFCATVFFPDEVDNLTLKLNSLWEPNGDAVYEPPIAENSSGDKRGGSAKRDVAEPGLDLETPVGLELLGDELVEDSLWEEGVLRSRAEGVRSGQAVLDALAEIEGWTPIENGYNQARLAMYLRYPKLWVRLSAYAFALRAKVLSSDNEARLARLIALKHRDNPAQIHRFLTRYERKDPALFEELKKKFVQPEASAPEEPITLEPEEDSADAS